MKTCFSLSSLPAGDATPDKGVVKPRLYSSLTKKRVKATAVRKSWESTSSEHRDEFWSVLQANYNYIMDNHLIDKCQETNFDSSSDSGTFQELHGQFSELYYLLNSIQDAIYGKEENITDKALRAHYINVLSEKKSLLQSFNDQASQLVQLHSKPQEEVEWLVEHLNSKWKTVLSMLEPSGSEQETCCMNLEHEIKCLRKWLNMMELRIPELKMSTRYTEAEFETRKFETKLLQNDIDNHGKIVKSVVKLSNKPNATCNTNNVRRIVIGLEERWQRLFLRCLEWQCYLDLLSKQDRNTSTLSDDTDSDCNEEPVNKHPRLSYKERLELASDRDTPTENDSGYYHTASEFTSLNSVMNDETEQHFDSVDGVDTSHFNKPCERAKNSGYYCYKHEDTDLDMEKSEMKNDTQSTVDETSTEEEWTFMPNYDAKPKSKPVPVETIRKLVLKAEELVSPDKSKKFPTMTRTSKVKRWLNRGERPDDSRDASCEDDERESEVSEDFDQSTTTFQACDSQNTSFTELNHAESTPKVVLRQRKYHNNRPWSVSCISQLDHTSPNKVMQDDFSISESALHKITLTSKNLERFNTLSAHSFGNNSTSSTLEEGYQMLGEKTSPNRRKRFKLKKKSMCTKSDASLALPKNRNALIKSDSFSGCTNKLNLNERHTSSDPSAAYLGKYEMSTSGADSEEESRRLPTFRLDAKTHYMNVTDKSSSLGKSEEHSSLSEQVVWDSYQEKYLSEAYSETHDSDAARRLLDFGEDYGKFLDSQSDWSANRLESDSDTESLRQLLNNSRDQLNYTKRMYEQQAAMGLNEYLTDNTIGEMLTTCDRHIKLLNGVTKSSDDLPISKGDKAVVAELLEQWTILHTNVFKMHILQEEILLMKDAIFTIKLLNTDSTLNLASADDLPQEVEFYEKKLEDAKELKKKLLPLNLTVHRFMMENLEYRNSRLKTDVADLYRIWDDFYTHTDQRLSQLKPLLQQWNTLDNRLDQLQVDLRDDEKTLHLLDRALQGGALSDRTATYVRDVAKLLSETTTVQGCIIPELFSEGGSLSDSGISDEGSEHEIGERERRLAAIRRLVRQLEVVLAPDCKARLKMAERLNAAEEELKTLQKRCRSLIACTAGYSLPLRTSDDDVVKDPDDDDPNEPNPASWFKRVMRAALPIQLVIITLVCVACLLEPQCCDNMNNFAMSLSPQLRYIKGPPPV